MVTKFEELASLLRFSGDPVSTGGDGAWGAVFQRLGRRLPLDYLQFVSRYGYCAIDNFYLLMLNPFEESGRFWSDLERERAIDREDVDVFESDDPEVMFPRPKGMIPWGSTDDGGSLLWLADDGDPDDWSVFQESEISGMRFPGGMEDFLVASLRGDTVGLALGSGFPSSCPTYVDPVVPLVSAAVTFSRDLEWDAQALTALETAFSTATRSRHNSLVKRPGGWIVSWWASTLQVGVPPPDEAEAKQRVAELASALGVSIAAATPDDWADIVDGSR